MGIQLTEDDYLLGVFDLVGELMRFGITCMATSGELPGSGGGGGGGESTDVTMTDGGGMKEEEEGGGRRDIAMDLRLLRTCLEGMDMGRGSMLGKDVGKKMEVMRSCVEKVENSVYGMIVRGRERPAGWVPDLREEGRPEPIESY